MEVREPPQGPDVAFHHVGDNRLLFADVYMYIAGCLAHERPRLPLTVSLLMAAVLGSLKMHYGVQLCLGAGDWGLGLGSHAVW